FWVALAVFQVLFGLAIFAGTRQYYLSDPAPVDVGSHAIRQPSLEWPDPATARDLAQFGAAMPGEMTSEDPREILRRADEFFANQQYDAAADLYARLLELAPDNVEIYNNLGLTLHYLGRSTEALGKLTEGVAIDPTHQRIWLTLGFVNSQLGNVEGARTALNTAAQINANNDIGKSASRMLEELQ
ncbi:MAG: tetratricopeptide repeat protein, partial [Gammaproteobacteria bacterium]